MPMIITTSPTITYAPDPFLLTIGSVKADVAAILEDNGLNAMSYFIHMG
jgi:hypothetical protein